MRVYKGGGGGVYSRTALVATTCVSDHKSSETLTGFSEGDCPASFPNIVGGVQRAHDVGATPPYGKFCGGGGASYAYVTLAAHEKLVEKLEAFQEDTPMAKIFSLTLRMLHVYTDVPTMRSGV